MFVLLAGQWWWSHFCWISPNRKSWNSCRCIGADFVITSVSCRTDSFICIRQRRSFSMWWYCNIAIVNQTKVLVCLDGVSIRILDEHFREIRDICNWFESIEKGALEMEYNGNTAIEWWLHVARQDQANVRCAGSFQCSLKVCDMLIFRSNRSDGGISRLADESR